MQAPDAGLQHFVGRDKHYNQIELYCDSGMQAPDAAFSTHADPSFAARDQHWPTTNHTYNIIQTTNAIVLLL